jgi:AraC-like DNA-binding protein
MKNIENEISGLLRFVEQKDLVLEKEVCGFAKKGVDMSFPYVIIFLCLRGSATALYDLRKISVEKDTLAVIMPKHIIRPLDNSEDFAYMRIAISSEILGEVKNHILGHEYDVFHKSPTCQLTDVQAERVKALAEVLSAIAQHDMNELLLRRQMLQIQLAIAYEFIHYYRREEDKRWDKTKYVDVYNRFTDLVVAHYKENRNVNYYAALLDYDQQYFTKLFRKASGGVSPLEWIQQYVVTQAKLLMDANPKQSIKEVAYQLGFPNTANFCRYFRTATNMTPQQYKDKSAQH